MTERLAVLHKEELENKTNFLCLFFWASTWYFMKTLRKYQSNGVSACEEFSAKAGRRQNGKAGLR